MAHKALVWQLVKNYDLMFNILQATISNKKEGKMVLEISAPSKAGFNKGVKFLKDQGVMISTPEHQIFKDEGNLHPLRGLHSRLSHRSPLYQTP